MICGQVWKLQESPPGTPGAILSYKYCEILYDT